MSSCIICGTSVDGRICDTHQEDVMFEFRGSRPGQLTPGRYYRGSVDGFAEFGVFVDIGDSVTGLLHESEIDQRLDNLDWEPGDTVFVQVKNVRDNGNIDLGWSIRQSEREFRGHLIDDPSEDHPILPEEDEEGNEQSGSSEPAHDGSSSESPSDDVTDESSDDAAAESNESADETPSDDGSDGSDDGEAIRTASGDASHGETGAVRTRQAETERSEDAQTEVVEDTDETEDVERADVATLSESMGETVAIEGVVESVRQTSGPTVFELRDGTGTVDCAAFEEAGVRAFPEIEADEIVRLVGEVRERRGEIQVETETLTALTGDDGDVVTDRMESAMVAKARPDAVDPLVEDTAVAALSGSLRDAAGAIRRAVFEERPVVVRHSATADGYVAGAALERATLPLVREQHASEDAEYHYFDRRPLEGDVYDMDDATKDVTNMLGARERHDEPFPLFVFVAAGGTVGSLDGLEFLDVYDAPRVVVDTVAEDDVLDVVDTVVSPDGDVAEQRTVDGRLDGPTAAVLAANVAAHVNEVVREDLTHLPAISYWQDVPERYAEAADAAGYDADAVADIRDAIALEAYYQSYEDKRQLVADLLFDGDADEEGRGLASHVSEQFRTKLETAIETAEANLDTRTVDGVDVAVLDTESFTHRFDFPPETLLLDELFRRTREDVAALVGVSDDDLHLRSDQAIDVRTVADEVAEAAPNAGVSAGSTRSKELTFLVGERDAVLDAVVDTIGGHLA